MPEDDRAIAELVRVLKPGGALAITVPRWLPERVCWALSDEYHANEGGHIRIYRADELRGKVLGHGLRLTHTHHAHALHSPFWWLKCLVGTSNSDHPRGDGLPQAVGVGHDEPTVADQDGRVAAEPAHRQERGDVLREAGGARCCDLTSPECQAF